MARPKKQVHLLRVKQIKINLTKDELEKYNRHKNRLLEYSPTLSPNDLLRKIVNNIDDLSLIQFLELDKLHPLKTKLLNDFLLSHIKIK